MLKKKLLAILAVGSFAFAANAQTAPEPEIKVHGNVQIQGGKALYDNNKSDNLDQFWGRANFGASVIRENVSGRINIRAFPAGFGYEVLTGATFDTTGEGALRTNKTGIPSFQIENAWIQHNLGLLSTKVGRFDYTTSKTVYFGNYLNQNSGGSFLGKVAYFNALELISKTGPLTSSIMFAAFDQNLNKGSLRIYERYIPLEGLALGAGYFSNIFDKVQNDKAKLENRFVVNGEYVIQKRLMPYFEVGIIENLVEDSWDVPINVGIELPAGKILDYLALEMEYTNETKREDNPLGVNLAMTKSFSKNSKFQLGLATDTQTDSFGDMFVSLRYTGSM